LGARIISGALGLGALRDRAGEIIDRPVDVALAAIDLAAPEKAVLHRRIHRQCGVEVAEGLVELTGLDIDTRAPDIGLREVLAHRHRLVEIGKRFGESLLVGPQEAARGQHRGIFRIERDRAIIIGERHVEFAGALAHIGARYQRADGLRIELQGGFRVRKGRIELAVAGEDARPAKIGLYAVVGGALRVIEDRRAGGLDLVRDGPHAIFEIAGGGPTWLPAQGDQRKRRQQGEADGRHLAASLLEASLSGPLEGRGRRLGRVRRSLPPLAIAARILPDSMPLSMTSSNL
jgi:hypothetical protein